MQGAHPCPLAFLATDKIREVKKQKRYTPMFTMYEKAMMEFTTSYIDCDEQDILSVTAMIIGAVAIARTMGNKNLVLNLLAACRREAGLKLGVV